MSDIFGKFDEAIGSMTQDSIAALPVSESKDTEISRLTSEVATLQSYKALHQSLTADNAALHAEAAELRALNLKFTAEVLRQKAEVERVNTELAKVGCSDGYFRATVAALEVAADTPGVSVEHRRQFLASMIAELAHAYRKHGARPWSRHEFYAVMREEVDEVWDAIKTDQPITEVLKEAMQIAAVCLRYAETEDTYRGSHPLPLPTRAALAPAPQAQEKQQ